MAPTNSMIGMNRPMSPVQVFPLSNVTAARARLMMTTPTRETTKRSPCSRSCQVVDGRDATEQDETGQRAATKTASTDSRPLSDQ